MGIMGILMHACRHEHKINFVGSHLEMRDLFLNNSKSAHLVAVASPGGLKNVTTCKCDC